MYGMKERIKDPALTEFTYKRIRWQDMEWKFGCPTYEMWVADWINNALYKNAYPDFSSFNDPKVSACHCSEANCCWNEAEILERLTKIGIWKRVEEFLSVTKPRTIATFTDDDGVEVNGVKYPYLAGLGYMDDEAVKEMKKIFPKGYIVYSKHDNEYVYFLPDGSYELLEMR